MPVSPCATSTRREAPARLLPQSRGPRGSEADRCLRRSVAHATETLALAYTFAGREHYAARAAHLVRIWFLDPATATTPDLVYAQAIPGTMPGHTQVIDTRFLPRLIDAVGLIAPSKAWTEEDQTGLVAWFREFLSNVRRRADDGYRNSVHNIASYYHVQTAAMALFIGDDAQTRELIAVDLNRLHLLCGLPLAGQQSLGGWLFHPSSAEKDGAKNQPASSGYRQQ